MDRLELLRNQVARHLFLVVLLNNLILIEMWWVNTEYLHLDDTVLLIVLLTLAILMPIVLGLATSGFILSPLRAVWQAVFHIAPGNRPVAAPNVDALRLGRDLVASLTAEIYQMATRAEHPGSRKVAEASAEAKFVLQNLPLPLFILNAEQNIVFCNEPAAKYLGYKVEEIVGQNLYSVLDMSFPSESTFDGWFEQVQRQNAVASSLWERVRLNVADKRPARLFDLAAYYNQGNPNKLETMLVLFDHTDQYSQDDQAVSFIALAVHELRTPLTLLRGYIEVFEEELSPQLAPELADFMHKMRASSDQLTEFVNNILNVARIDGDQLVLQLHEESWPVVLKRAIDTMQLRASVRGITLEVNIAEDLPTVGVDRVGIQEVINNLIDNAIKYSGKSMKISIDAHLTQDGMVETTVQDWGMGIPASIIPNLFTKFYRDHRNRAQIGGTGLGLYLCKALIGAHGGHIWVRSKENEGSTFGFTVVPYARLDEERKHPGNKEITRSPHGWIKNHSLYRG